MACGLSDCEVNLKRNQKHVEEQVHASNEMHDRHALLSKRHMELEIEQTKQSLKDIIAKTPVITVSENDSVGTKTDGALTLNSHVRAHTQENIRACERLSRSLGKHDHNRERSLSPRPLHSGNLVTVSSKSIENLQKAASVLKNTEHAIEVQKLLSTLQSK